MKMPEASMKQNWGCTYFNHKIENLGQNDNESISKCLDKYP